MLVNWSNGNTTPTNSQFLFVYLGVSSVASAYFGIQLWLAIRPGWQSTHQDYAGIPALLVVGFITSMVPTILYLTESVYRLHKSGFFKSFFEIFEHILKRIRERTLVLLLGIKGYIVWVSLEETIQFCTKRDQAETAAEEIVKKTKQTQAEKEAHETHEAFSAVTSQAESLLSFFALQALSTAQSQEQSNPNTSRAPRLKALKGKRRRNTQPLHLDEGIMEGLTMLHIAIPRNSNEVPEIARKIQDRIEAYNTISDRVTKERVARGESALQKPKLELHEESDN